MTVPCKSGVQHNGVQVPRTALTQCKEPVRTSTDWLGFIWVEGRRHTYTSSSSKQVTLSEEPYKVPSSVETEILLSVRHPPHIGNGKFSPFLAKFNETNQSWHRRHTHMKQSKTFSFQNQKKKIPLQDNHRFLESCTFS
jgi:hypothetical protein